MPTPYTDVPATGGHVHQVPPEFQAQVGGNAYRCLPGPRPADEGVSLWVECEHPDWPRYDKTN